MITGDHPLTATATAERIGITGPHPKVVTAEDFEQLTEDQLAALIRSQPEVIFARASPEAKLHVAEALRCDGHAGDSTNRSDARPELR